MFGNAYPHHPSSNRHGIKHPDLVTAPGKIVGSAQASWTGPNNRDMFVTNDMGRSNRAALQVTMIGGEALEITNGYRLIELGAAARSFTGSGTDATTNGGKRIGLRCDLKRLVIASFAN